MRERRRHQDAQRIGAAQSALSSAAQSAYREALTHEKAAAATIEDAERELERSLDDWRALIAAGSLDPSLIEAAAGAPVRHQSHVQSARRTLASAERQSELARLTFADMSARARRAHDLEKSLRKRLARLGEEKAQAALEDRIAHSGANS